MAEFTPVNIQWPNYAQTLSQMLQLKNMQAEGRKTEMEMGELEREMQNRQILNSIMGKGAPVQETSQELLSKGFFKEAEQVTKAYTSQIDSQEKSLDMALQLWDRTVIPGRPETAQKWAETALGLGLPEDMVQYALSKPLTPERHREVSMAGLSAMDRMKADKTQQEMVLAQNRDQRDQARLGLAYQANARAAEKAARGDVPKPSAQAKKADELMATFGLTKEESADIAYGLKKVVVNPVTGNPELVNLRTNESRSLSATNPDAPPVGDVAANPGKSIFNAAESAAGVVPATKELAADVFGQFGANIAPETVQDRQMIEAEVGTLIRALSINPRFPVGEIERIKEEIKITPSMLSSKPAFQNRVIAIDRSLRRRLEKEKRTAQNTALPKEQRQNAAAAANDIENFLSVLGAPPTITKRTDYDALPVGAPFVDKNSKVRVKKEESKPIADQITPPIDRLQEGQTTTFTNGQQWTLENGTPVRVN